MMLRLLLLFLFICVVIVCAEIETERKAVYKSELKFNNSELIDANVHWISLQEEDLITQKPIAEPKRHRYWIDKNWHFTIYVSIVYMVVIFLGAQYMKSRPAFDLRGSLSLWSASLAIFSIMGTIRCLPEFLSILYNEGFIQSFCSNSYRDDDRLVFWYLVFIWSKIVELGDTAFIILRKQKLINLHWIHHVLTLVYCFFVFPDRPGTARWMVGMNFAIHSLMYTYYSLRALRIHIPRGISMTITIAQIVQMIFGLIINFISFKYVTEGTKCDMTLASATTGLALYSLFFILFINFFICSYFLRPKTKRIVFINDNNHNKIEKIDKKFE